MAYLSRKVSFSSELALAGKSLSLTLQASSDALGCVRTPASSIPKIKNMVIITVFAVDTPIDFASFIWLAAAMSEAYEIYPAVGSGPKQLYLHFSVLML